MIHLIGAVVNFLRTNLAENYKQPAHLACVFAFGAFVESLSASTSNVDELQATIDELSPSLLIHCRLTNFVSSMLHVSINALRNLFF